VVTLGLLSAGCVPLATDSPNRHESFGGWNEALEAMGVGTTIRAGQKGLLKFTREDYDDAVRDFCFHAQRAINATYAGMTRGRNREIAEGRERPSGASVRIRHVVDAVQLRAGVGVGIGGFCRSGADDSRDSSSFGLDPGIRHCRSGQERSHFGQ
jgi:hypothetical protein